MLMRYEHHGLTWIDLEQPTRDEVRLVMEEFRIEPLVAEELLLPTVKPRAELHADFLYVILHFPALRHTHTTKEQEVDFVIGRDFIVTTRYDTIDPLHKFSKVFEVNSVLDKSDLGEHAGFIFFYMLKKLYRSVEHEISYVHDALEDIEGNIFGGREREMVEALSRSGRDLLNMRQAIEPHRDVLRDLEEFLPSLLGAAFTPYARALTNEYFRVYNHIARQSESLRELRETNNSLLNTKQNEIMKILTIVSFVTFPLSIVAAVFGMNTTHTPLVEGPYGFWVILALMVALGTGLFVLFKHKGWL